MRFRTGSKLFAALLFTACGGSASQTVETPARTSRAPVEFIVDPPRINRPLPVFELSNSEAPVALVNDLLARARSGGTALGPLAETALYRRHGLKAATTLIGADDREHVKVWVDLTTGDAEIYPTFSQLKAFTPASPRDLTERARSIAQVLIPDDPTTFEIGRGEALHRINADLGAPVVPPPDHVVQPEYLIYVPIHRRVGGLPVEGPGSRAMLAFDHEGQVQGLARSWRKVTRVVRTVTPNVSTDRVREAVRRQLEVRGRQASVNDLRVVYYDGNQRFLQPMYRFTARVSPLDTPNQHPTFLVGYIPLSPQLEPLPTLPFGGGLQLGPVRSFPVQPFTPQMGAPPRRSGQSNPSQKSVTQPVPAAPLPSSLQSPAPPVAPLAPLLDPNARSTPRMQLVPEAASVRKLGRYLAAALDPPSHNSAAALWDSLRVSPAGPMFTSDPATEADVDAFRAERLTHVDSVQLALLEAHGIPGQFFTNGTNGGPVQIDSLGPPGYGRAASGALNDWIIHSCEVVESYDDSTTWDARWWKVFGGVRNVVGYRTVILLNDLATTSYGTKLGLLSPIASSWFNTILLLTEYERDRMAPTAAGDMRPVGRPSSVSVCDRTEDSVLTDFDGQAATCLVNWWIGDVRTGGGN